MGQHSSKGHCRSHSHSHSHHSQNHPQCRSHSRAARHCPSAKAAPGAVLEATVFGPAEFTVSRAVPMPPGVEPQPRPGALPRSAFLLDHTLEAVLSGRFPGWHTAPEYRKAYSEVAVSDALMRSSSTLQTLQWLSHELKAHPERYDLPEEAILSSFVKKATSPSPTSQPHPRAHQHEATPASPLHALLWDFYHHLDWQQPYFRVALCILTAAEPPGVLQELLRCMAKAACQGRACS
eukprot:RCo039821